MGDDYELYHHITVVDREDVYRCHNAARTRHLPRMTGRPMIT
ncbi:hypothetical protein TMO_1742 [Tistrella mobilis KA081020-065]|uniref:Uncharacterized protein n=1 Tax=Tistrella mobilis (strain KA081020-065) TaxID=1110502 RepID=I3TLE3_TISMK|nr:hypothetical protein TMO_1742 [Tistrella mobilis KA081020-065]